MPYTNIWNSNSPLGSQAANTADDELRKFRLDMEERLEDKIITDITVDPWIVRPEILGNVINKSITIHHSAFQPVDIQGSTLHEISRTALYSEHNGIDMGASNTWWAPVILPSGVAGSVTITNVEFVVNRNNAGANNITGKLSYNTVSAAPATTVVGSVATTVNGINIISFAPAHLVIQGRAYFIEAVMPGPGLQPRLYSVKLTYDTPDCRVTL